MKKDKPIKLCVCLPCILNYGRVAAAPTVVFFNFIIIFFISTALVVHTHKHKPLQKSGQNISTGVKGSYLRASSDSDILSIYRTNICPYLHSYAGVQRVAVS